MPNEALAMGELAPDFTLKDQHDHPVTLSEFRGKQVVLSFHPLAWTGVCTTQMKDLEARHADILGLGAVALGISVDSVPCKKAWAASMGVSETALLADFWPHGKVIQSYGIFHEEFGISRRVVFIVNEEGRITWRKIYPTKQAPDIVEILENLEEDSA